RPVRGGGRARRAGLSRGAAAARRRRGARLRERRRSRPNCCARTRQVIRVAVAGAAGRMGQTVCAAVEAAEDMELAGRADPLLSTTLEEVLPAAEVVVEFTTPDTALANALACIRAGVHVVIGTTGFDPAPLGRAVAEE